MSEKILHVESVVIIGFGVWVAENMGRGLLVPNFAAASAVCIQKIWQGRVYCFTLIFKSLAVPVE